MTAKRGRRLPADGGPLGPVGSEQRLCGALVAVTGIPEGAPVFRSGRSRVLQGQELRRVMLVRAGLDPAGTEGVRPPGALLPEAA
ncbi:hypothetical protein ACWCQN_21830 [Streptomyces sp. NPDC001984]